MTSDDATPASEVYEIVRTQASAVVRRLARVSAVFVGLLLSAYPDSAKPGGSHVRVVEKATGREMLAFTEELGDDGQGTGSSIQADLANSSADAFARKWLR